MNSKQVLVLRKDINMRKGKMCAQAAHASMKVLLDTQKREPDLLGDPTGAWRHWLDGSFTKITVSVNSEAELRAIYDAALSKGLPASFIIDNGLTEFAGQKTPTAVAIGPAWAEEIDPITKHLPLL